MGLWMRQRIECFARIAKSGILTAVGMAALMLLVAKTPKALAVDVPALAILGDSLSTGAATHPALQFDGQVLWDVFTGKISVQPTTAALPSDLAAGLPEPPPAPLRMWPGVREFFGGPDWVWRNALQAISRSYLDTAQYSWGYQTGLGLRLSPNDIAIVGEDGARVANIPRHVDRLLAFTEGSLPQRVAVFYTGNDLCGSNINEITAPADFASGLERGLLYLLRNGKAPEQGTDVYVFGYMGILQLLTSESILAKKVHAFASETTCKDLRAANFLPNAEQQKAMQARAQSRTGQDAVAWYFSLLMPPNPAGFCGTLFAGGVGREREREAEINTLANHIRSYREHTAQVVERLNVRAEVEKSKVRFHYIDATTKLTFTGDDVGEDCFHLSIAGHTKIARAAISALVAP